MTYLFEDLGRALNKIAQKLNKDQSLIRLLEDMSSNPLDETKEDIDTSVSHIGDSILIVPKAHPNEITKGLVVISIIEFAPGDNMDFNEARVQIDILCPLDKWMIDDICPRPYKIMSQIYEDLEQSRVTGIGTMSFMGEQQTVIYNDVSDHQMLFTVTANG